MARAHAFEWLLEPSAEQTIGDVVVLAGNDAVLRKWCIDRVVGGGDWNSVDGDAVQWSDLQDDLATASLFDFDDGKRTLVIRRADKFVSSNRAAVESYLAAPGSTVRFVLELQSLASNTRLYKAVVQDHLFVHCGNANDAKQGVTAAKRRQFLTKFVAPRHQAKLNADAADALVELLGEEVGLLDSEIAKLAVYTNVGGKIDDSMVREITAGWQGKTVWEINAAIASGNAAEALLHLDKLFGNGQRAIALLPQIAWSLRRLGLATAFVQYREQTGRTWQFEEALAAAGIRRGGEVQASRKQLQSLGRNRASSLLPLLLDADLRLKGTHSAEGRDRWLLEQLVLKLARHAPR